jgi:formate dehydrogenase major subunit
VAEREGIRIPTLCNDRRLEPFASCWVCLVKVERAKGFVPSCGTMVAPGMVVSTSSPDVLAARKMAFELLLSSHYGDCKAPCTLTCPSNVDIQGYLGLVANGRLEEAVALIRRDNPMPAVIGRICPRPCEEKCRRNLVEEPLNINGVKRFVADLEARAGGMPVRTPSPKIGKKVAVIGGGPAGLSAAWYLSEKGVDVTIFEAMEKAGGMLRYGIPDYRLPPEVLDRTIGEMLSMGAELRTGVALGRDVTLEGLRSQYDAVVLAIGAWKSRGLRIPGEEHPEVLSGIDFLRDVNAGKPVRVGARVAIIGGGNTAMDAARCSLRLGASKVTMYYRRTREEMPASDAEIDETLEEGVDIQYLAAPVSIQAEGASLKSLTLLRMELGEPDASGRRRPVPVDGSEYTVEVDTVISAVGQYADTKLLSGSAGLAGIVDEKGNLAADTMTGVTGVPGVFAAGDLLTGTDIAIRAIAGGKHAARAALAYFAGRAYERPKEFLSKKSDFREPTPADFTDTPRAPRAAPHVLAPETRKRTFTEIEKTFSREQALAEAARCLECGCQDVKDCALKLHATEYDATATRFLGEVGEHPIDESHPFIARDPSKCVLCGRCVRICLEVQGIGVLGYIYRGFATVVAPSFGVPFGKDASCISCGQCVSACPVGALTEKLQARKTVPLLERIEEGSCSLCSIGCAIEYRWHGSLLTRITERNEAPNHGKLCKKGKFGHGFLNEAALASPSVSDLEAARASVDMLLSASKAPLMRISPSLCGEAIDLFLDAAAKKGIPVEAAGLAKLDPRWSTFAAAQPGASAHTGIRILVGDIADSNNVAFTEAFRLRRQGVADLWIVGPGDMKDGGANLETARRAASRVFPTLAELKGAIEEASAKAAVIVVVNPEEIFAKPGAAAEKIVLETLLAAHAGGKGAREGGVVRVALLWNSRNAGYLFGRLTAGSTTSGYAGTAPSRKHPPKKPDLLLDVGIEEPTNGVKRIVWGKQPAADALFIPLPVDLWIRGRSHPTGREAIQAGMVDVTRFGIV